MIEATLKKSITTTQRGYVSLICKVIGAEMSGKVFAIEVLPRSIDTAAPYYRFSHVCSPTELTEFPEEEPHEYCYFRTDEVELVFDNKEKAELTYKHIKEDITALVKELRALASTEADETIEVINPVEPLRPR